MSSAGAKVQAITLEFWERVFDDEDGKDVELEAADGSVRTHSQILAHVSEPFKKMLSAGMMEQRTKKIKLQSFKAAQLKFVLRLMHTGQIDPCDWPHEAEKMDRASTRKRRRKEPGSVDSEDDFIRGPPSRGRLGSPTKSARSVSPMSERSVSSTNDGGSVPLSILLGSLEFAKQYEISRLVSLILDFMRPRICLSNFDKVFQQAVAIDMSPLKLMCIEFARKNSRIKDMFDKGQLSAEVSFELQSLWTAPIRKKRRMVLDRASLGDA